MQTNVEGNVRQSALSKWMPWCFVTSWKGIDEVIEADYATYIRRKQHREKITTKHYINRKEKGTNRENKNLEHV